MKLARVAKGRTPAGLLSIASLGAAALGQPAAIRAGGFVDATGSIENDALVLVENGLIRQVGGEVPGHVPTDSYPGAVLSPGLIDCCSALGSTDDLSERQTAIQPKVNARDAFNRYSAQLNAALAAGVTAFALTPDDDNLIGGRIAVCQTSGPDGAPRLLTDTGPLKLSLSPEVFAVDREPTSRADAIGLLRETLQAAGRDESAPDPLRAFATGRIPGVVTVPSAADVFAALELAQSYGLSLVLNHTRDARLIAEQVAAHAAGVIVGPLDLHAGRRETAAAGSFERHGVKVALAGGLPVQAADSLRIGAALAAREGLSLEAARRAITVVPAEFLGVADRLGAIKVGNQADLVVFSGDPLDLRSRVLAVYVSGQRVYTAERESAGGGRP